MSRADRSSCRETSIRPGERASPSSSPDLESLVASGAPPDSIAASAVTGPVAAVALERPLRALYSYSIPESLRGTVAAGSRVVVPLGRGSCEGIVVSTGHEGAPEGKTLRDLTRVLGEVPALQAGMLELGAWISRTYLCSHGEALMAMVLPWAAPRAVRMFELAPDAPDPETVTGSRRRQLLAYLIAMGGAASGEQVRGELGDGAVRVLGELTRRGLVRQSARERLPDESWESPVAPFPPLSDEQQPVQQAISEDILAGRHRVHLLHGVTGSGKTEVYLHLIRQVLEERGGAIFLVPEISLTVPMIELFRSRFGSRLALFHSGLTASQRHREWVRVRHGRARVVVGARSAVFAPVQELRLLVIDEEAETSYKQQERPCYHARSVAIERGRIGGFPVVLGSATPSLESYHRARIGEYAYHRLERRFNRQPLPAIELVDMTLEFRERRNRSIFSCRLKEALASTLDGGRQCLLFLNRRGHSTYVFCRACGAVLECTQCSVALTYHQADGICRCHQCDVSRPSPEQCGECGSRAIRFLGLGTQRVEEELTLNFPGVPYARMDSDTTSSRGAHERIFEDFSRGRTRVLVGTQMVAKGFNFAALDLVGVVNADVTLRLPDFRAAERTFQLVTQVAGRVGRADRPGAVLVQTYAIDHHALQLAARNDYQGFADQELALRRELGYPPFATLILAAADSEREELARAALEGLAESLKCELGDSRGLRVLGPARAALARIKGRHRFQLLLKVSPGHPEMEARLNQLLACWSPPAGVNGRVDVDPSFLG